METAGSRYRLIARVSFCSTVKSDFGKLRSVAMLQHSSLLRPRDACKPAVWPEPQAILGCCVDIAKLDAAPCPSGKETLHQENRTAALTAREVRTTVKSDMEASLMAQLVKNPPAMQETWV